MQFFIQVWLFATTVIYSASDVPECWRALLTLNPMSGGGGVGESNEHILGSDAGQPSGV